jgi:phosphopantothenoylcysteine synthetase/decarboxylase
MTARPRFLVTAGSTREMIDRVRDWGNVFTGNTGFAIAQMLKRVGEVELLTSNATHRALSAKLAHRFRASGFTSHADLEQALQRCMATAVYDGVFMTAAVADYRPTGVYEVIERSASGDGSAVEHWVVRNVQADKVKSTFDEIAVTGARTVKLVDLFRTRWRFTGFLVKFKLEVGIDRDQLIRVGQASRAASGADYLVANTLDMVSGENAGAYLLDEHGQEWVPRAELADRMAGVAEEWVRTHRRDGRT